jgi:threonine dehydratase
MTNATVTAEVPVTLADIEAARERIRGGIYESPCVESIPLSQLTGAHIYCKLDYLQRTGSFKERGARNALLQLSAAQRERGVIAASAGNHAQGHRLPRRAARHSGHRGHAEVRAADQGDELPPARRDDRAARGRPVRSARRGGDDRRARRPDVHPSVRQRACHRGQGTIALEILEQTPTAQAIVAPVGGGGCSRASVPSLPRASPVCASSASSPITPRA